MPELASYDYAIVRVVPSVERGEFVNAGVILFCRTRRFLRAQIRLDEARLLALSTEIDLESVRHQLGCIPLVCQGGKAAGPIGLLSQTERFHWLTAPRSTIIQPSPVHSGLTADPALSLDHLMRSMVLPPSTGLP